MLAPFVLALTIQIVSAHCSCLPQDHLLSSPNYLKTVGPPSRRRPTGPPSDKRTTIRLVTPCVPHPHPCGTTTYESGMQLKDVTVEEFRCYNLNGGLPTAPDVYLVNAGSDFRFNNDNNLYHPGVRTIPRRGTLFGLTANHRWLMFTCPRHQTAPA